MANPSINITLNVKPSFEELGKRFKGIDLTKAIQQGIEEFAFVIERYAKISSPIDTGRLRSSIATDMGNLRARVAPHVKYALFVHDGTKYMKGRPFMKIGESQARAKFFNGKSPFKIYIERAINDKLR